jgi:hypothetical protein
MPALVMPRSALRWIAWLAMLAGGPAFPAQQILGACYFTVAPVGVSGQAHAVRAAVDPDFFAIEECCDVSDRAVTGRLGPRGLPVYAGFRDSGLRAAINDLDSDNEITWWSPALDRNVHPSGAGAIALPYRNGAMFPPDGRRADGNDRLSRLTSVFTGAFDLPAQATVTFELGSDDDGFLYVDDALVLANGGIHAANSPTLIAVAPSLAAGHHRVTLFYADRQGAGAELYFSVVAPKELQIRATNSPYCDAHDLSMPQISQAPVPAPKPPAPPMAGKGSDIIVHLRNGTTIARSYFWLDLTALTYYPTTIDRGNIDYLEFARGAAGGPNGTPLPQLSAATDATIAKVPRSSNDALDTAYLVDGTTVSGHLVALAKPVRDDEQTLVQFADRVVDASRVRLVRLAPGSAGDWVAAKSQCGGIAGCTAAVTVTWFGYAVTPLIPAATRHPAPQRLSPEEFEALARAVRGLKLDAWKTSFDEGSRRDWCCDIPYTSLSLQVRKADGSWRAYSTLWHALGGGGLPEDVAAFSNAINYRKWQ